MFQLFLKKGRKSVLRAAVVALAVLLLAQTLPASSQAVGSYFLCDLSMDGTIGAEDARFALRMSVGLESYTEALQQIADADEDGSLTPADARLILRVSVGLERINIRLFSFTDEQLRHVIYTAPGQTGPEVPTTEPEPITEPESTTEPEPTTQPEPSTDPAGPVERFPLPELPMPVPSSKSGTFTFTSYGWGDGVGLSQYGAAGMARRGYNYRQILQYYFTGVKIVKAASYPDSTYYVGDYYDTEELIARMVYQEIYSIIEDNPAAHAEVLKAQAVALFTLLEYHNFRTNKRYEIGDASSRSYSSLPSDLKQAVHEVMGEYITQVSDPAEKPISALFFATCALSTASAEDVWGYDYPYLQSVPSPFDIDGYYFCNTFEVSKETMRSLILNYDSSIRLSSDPSEWLKIVSHSASIDDKRGYVRKIQVGDKVLDGYFDFCNGVMEDYFWVGRYFGGSTAFYVTYTP